LAEFEQQEVVRRVRRDRVQRLDARGVDLGQARDLRVEDVLDQAPRKRRRVAGVDRHDLGDQLRLDRRRRRRLHPG
jgi:hypothetical protein